MRYIEFKEVFKNRIVFSLNDYYCFSDVDKSELMMFYFANRIYKPSYISLHSALSYYNLIPEAVFGITSVSTQKTNVFHTPFGRFEYKNIKPSLFFGYRLLTKENLTVKIAEPEKLILDCCYLMKPETVSDFESLRLNREELIPLIGTEKLEEWLSVYHSKVMNRRISTFKSFLYA